MAKHDVGVKRRKGYILCYESYYGTYFRSSYSAILEIKLSSEPGYDIDEVMGGMIFDNHGNRIDEEAKKHYVTEEDLKNMRSKLGGYLR